MDKENIDVSHLQFANDAILFSNGTEVDMGYMVKRVHLFCKASSLKINLSKNSGVGN